MGLSVVLLAWHGLAIIATILLTSLPKVSLLDMMRIVAHQKEPPPECCIGNGQRILYPL